MDEFQNNGEERISDDEFYEKIEAPKFVDLTAPDRHRPDSDDRYWFCLRMGCDQKHEEEMDSEAIYKKFLLRVMAARSPSVRLRKALYRNDSPKCPRTVPAKASKSRISKLAVISSVSQNMVDANKKKTMPLSHPAAATHNKKLKQPYVIVKAMTTPRNRKRISNPRTFQSVRNPKPSAVDVPNSRVVAKALVFHSPNRAVKLKKSIELSSSLRKICSGMKRLEITNGKDASRLNKDASRKQLRGREVNSRVFDSLRPQKKEGQEAKPPKLLKTRNNDQEFQLSEASASSDRNQRNSNVVNIENKPEGISLKSCSEPATAGSSEGKVNRDCLDDVGTFQQQRDEHKSNTLSESSEHDAASSLDSGKGESERQEDNKVQEDTIEPSCEEKQTDQAVEIASASNGELMDKKLMDTDDKENASGYEENRNINSHASKSMKKNVIIEHESSQSARKEIKTMSRALKDGTVNSTKGQGTKYRKPKPTNPKPFRLRTDERRILKEANLEKKQLSTPVKEVTRIPGSQSGHNSQLQQENSNKTSIEFPGQTGTAQFDHKATEHPQRGPKSTFIIKVVRPQGVASRKKKAPGQLEAIKENSPANLKPKKTSKPVESSAATPVTSEVRRPAPTTPKEPKFHSIHTPKSCMRRVASPKFPCKFETEENIKTSREQCCYSCDQ